MNTTMNTNTNTNMNIAEGVEITDGNFSALLLDEQSRVMLEDAYQAVTKANRWGYLKRPDVPGAKSCAHCNGKNCTGRYMDVLNARCMCVDRCRVCQGKGSLEQGFMMLDSPELKDINIHMEYDGHSGSSYGWTMRQMESIAKKGWTAYVARVGARPPVPTLIPNPVTVFTNLVNTANVIDSAINEARTNAGGKGPATMDPLSFARTLQANPQVRAIIPDIDTQANAMSRFAEGKMSYAEMRGLCG